MERITNPRIGSIVRHTGWGFENDPNYPCDVIITNGQYMSDGRLSNFWYWKRITEDGLAEEEERGYGDFIAAENKYEIKTTVEKI